MNTQTTVGSSEMHVIHDIMIDMRVRDQNIPLATYTPIGLRDASRKVGN